MEQENGPSAPQQVVNISQVPMEDNKTLKDAYSSTAATILGVLQIIIGVVFFFGEIDISFRIIVLTCNFSAFFPFSLPFMFLSAFFCVSGGIAIGGASGNKCLMVTTMVMSIICTLSAIVVLMYPAIWIIVALVAAPGSAAPDRWTVLTILFMLAMLIVPTISAFLTCKPLCCQKTPSERVDQPNQAPLPSQPGLPSNQPDQQPGSLPTQPGQPGPFDSNPVNATSIIPSSNQAPALNINVNTQPSSSNMVSLKKEFWAGY